MSDAAPADGTPQACERWELLAQDGWQGPGRFDLDVFAEACTEGCELCAWVLETAGAPLTGDLASAAGRLIVSAGERAWSPPC